MKNRISSYLVVFQMIFGSLLSASIADGVVLPGKEYVFVDEPVDVVIPSCEKDVDTLEACIAGIKQNCENVGRVFVVSKNKLTASAEWIPESRYPFSKEEIAFELFQSQEQAKDYMSNPRNRLGWMYQQFLKLYAPFVIEGISSNVLIVDSDTVFLNPVQFTNEKGAAQFNYGTEYTQPYFNHMARLLPNLHRVFPQYSGICHHMLFQRAVLSDLQSHIENRHQKPMWKAIIHCMDHGDLYGSGFSEYEIYFNFAFMRSSQFSIRPLAWCNISTINAFDHFRASGCHYVSAHAWMR